MKISRREVRKAGAAVAAHECMLGHGAEPVGTTPAQFGDYLRADLARWANLTRTVSIKVD